MIPSPPFTATATAHPNIALIKYWGKAVSNSTNEPAVSSLSITLDTLVTETTVRFDPALSADSLLLNGIEDRRRLPRISAALDTLRSVAGVTDFCEVVSNNNFPTSAGLASSASGFAALVAATNCALNMGLNARQQSMLARGMSGSAARSVFGGFAKIQCQPGLSALSPWGAAYAEPVAPSSHWPLAVCIGIASETEKAIGSTEGMERSRLTSPYYNAWLEHNDADVREAEQAISNKDFARLAELSEMSCLKMHALAMASDPGLLYWQGVTVDAIHLVRDLRYRGVPVFFTIDAGPQIKAVCLPEAADTVADALSSLNGIKKVVRCGLGQGVRVRV